MNKKRYYLIRDIVLLTVLFLLLPIAILLSPEGMNSLNAFWQADLYIKIAWLGSLLIVLFISAIYYYLSSNTKSIMGLLFGLFIMTISYFYLPKDIFSRFIWIIVAGAYGGNVLKGLLSWYKDRKTDLNESGIP